MKVRRKGIKAARAMRRWSGKKGGLRAVPDEFDRSDPFTLASLMDEWFEYLRERNFSEKSIEAHHWDLKNFLTWAHERDLTRPEQITKPLLENYQRWLYRSRKANGETLGVTSQRRRLLSVQRHFAWMCKQNYLGANPASDLDLPRKNLRILPKALSKEEIRNLMAVPDVGDPLGVRDRSILETFYSTGIRRTELASLEIADVDRNRGILSVRQGKGSKDRMVPLGKVALGWLEKYLERVRPKLEVSGDEKALYLTGYGEKFSPGYLGNWVKKTMKQAGIEKTGSCHLLRHTCATHMLEGGSDIRYIQQLLGHSKLDTTAIYTEVGIYQLQQIHKNCHPAG